MSRPVWVHVLWSESSEFKDNDVLSFDEFERKARFAASLVSEGYDKTKINVLFDDGMKYGCRLDLSPIEDSCFASHALSLVRWYERQTDESKEGYSVASFKSNYEFLKSIEWGG
jgi:hypothetical protein